MGRVLSSSGASSCHFEAVSTLIPCLVSSAVALGSTLWLPTVLSSEFPVSKCGWLCCDIQVTSLDLSWNYATESQAYDRVHRLGQEKEVFVKRLVVRDTIEDR